jgi:hypothetical protein
MSIPFIISLLASICLIPVLYAGARSDVKTRTFPKDYWVYAFPAGIFTIMQYTWMIFDGDIWEVTGLIGISIAFSLFFVFMGLRFGSGGDWRALMYIALISPALIIQTCILSLIAGAVLVFWYIGVSPKGTDLRVITIPFAVAILAGYTGAFMIRVLTVG